MNRERWSNPIANAMLALAAAGLVSAIATLLRAAPGAVDPWALVLVLLAIAAAFLALAILLDFPGKPWLARIAVAAILLLGLIELLLRLAGLGLGQFVGSLLG
ncbi:MAG TPA: hypothetical protein VMF53_11745 [Alphaproteobacteria bacterium]|nr:hypothetical protein [Alphaproteobacteria bacterium]